MMELFPIAGSTWAIRGGATMTVVYRINETDCVLIDPGHPANRGEIEAVLAAIDYHYDPEQNAFV